jgi:cation transport regulator ChaB
VLRGDGRRLQSAQDVRARDDASKSSTASVVTSPAVARSSALGDESAELEAADVFDH